MGNFENKNFEPQIKKPEKEISKIENREIPEQKYINACEEIGKNNEFIKQICKNLNINLRAGLETQNIDFLALVESKGLDLA